MLKMTIVRPSPLHPWSAVLLRDGVIVGEVSEAVAQHVEATEATLASLRAVLAVVQHGTDCAQPFGACSCGLDAARFPAP